MAFSSLGRRLPGKTTGILGTTQSDNNASPFEDGAVCRAENGSIGAFPGPSRAAGLPIHNGLKLLTQSLTKEAADSMHPVYKRCAHGHPLGC